MRFISALFVTTQSVFGVGPRNPWTHPRKNPPPPVSDSTEMPIHYNPEVRPGDEDYHDDVTVPGSGNKRYSWPNYNNRVHKPDGSYRPGYVCHMRGNFHYSPEKMFYCAVFIRGMTVDEALKQLQFKQMKGAQIVSEVLQEARELAINEHNFEHASNMWVAESFVNQAQMIKGRRRHARGRFGTLKYRFSNYYVRFEEGKPPKNYYEWKAKKTPEEWLQDYIIEHRNKRIYFD